MEIHSSSLAYIPARVNAAKKTGDSLDSNNKQGLAKDNVTPAAIVEINNNQENKQSAQLTKKLEAATNIIPQHTQTARALNAYINENNSQLNKQLSNLDTIIDEFV